MSYISLTYLLVFIPIVLLLYNVLPRKYRGYLLLISSYIFFFLQSSYLIIYILGTTLVTYIAGLYIEKQKNDVVDKKDSKRKAKSLLFGILIVLGTLIIVKYTPFFAKVIDGIFDGIKIKPIRFLVPIGISFYTMQAISYLVDVYRDKIKADEKISRLALYLSFFPIILEGPICRYDEIAYDLFKGNSIKYNNMVFGIQRIGLGVFKNLIIADRVNLFVKAIFEGYREYSGLIVVIASILYTIQLYMNFSGSIDITVGIGEIFGLKIPENFRQPFFAKTTAEFWQRWHITLGSWFKDYLFYPISLSKPVKKMSKKIKNWCGRYTSQMFVSFIALFVVWFSNGLWHGPRLSYLFFGMYYFTIIFISKLTEPIMKRIITFLRLNKHPIFYRFIQTIKMLIIVIIGEMFFRAEGLKAGLYMFKSIFRGFDLSQLTNNYIFGFGMSYLDFIIVIIGVIVVLIIDICHENNISLRKVLAKQNIFVRWTIYYIVIFVIIIFGAYGVGYIPVELIYAGF